jgi:hypothetical protein
MLHMCVCCILASSRITRSGFWKTDPHFLGGLSHEVKASKEKDLMKCILGACLGRDRRKG